MQTRRLSCFLAVAILAGAGALRADDTDIYTNRVLPPTSLPLVMFSLDLGSGLEGTYANCVNVGTAPSMCPPAQFFYDRCPSCRPLMPAATQPFRRYDAIRFAIRTALLENGGMKVGLMLPHNDQKNCTGTGVTGCSNGGYIARGFKAVDTVAVPFTSPPQLNPGPNLQEFLNILDSMPINTGLPDHPFQGKEMFFELFRYLTGQDVYNAHNGWIDYGTDTTQNLNVDNPAIDWDASIEVPLVNRYISPITSDLSCSKIFTVNFLLNPSRQDDDSDAAISSGSAGGMIGLDLSGASRGLENVVGYLNDVDLARSPNPFGSVPVLEGTQNVTSFFFSRPTPVDSSPPKYNKSVVDYAIAGGTNRPLPLNDDPALLVQNLNSVVGQILSVSTTFVAASIPVNVFNRSQTLSDVYTALFQAESTGKPFWPGNLKKLKLDPVAAACAPGDLTCTQAFDVSLVDALGQQAVASDGRIRNEALTFWTNGAVIAANPTKGVLAGRDGRHVDRGGAGQKIPGFVVGSPGTANSEAGARQLYTYPGTGTSLIPLTADLGTATLLKPALGTADVATAQNLLLCVRGYDCLDADADLITNEVRPWLLGDPLHSRPHPINFGAINGHTKSNPLIYIAMGTNDGFLHLFRNTSSTGTELGTESWAFMPTEALAIQERLALNNVTTTRLYGVDGAPSTYIKDVDGDGNVEPGDGDKVYLYFGLRRGGRSYYAFDITNPESPQFLWRVAPSVSATLTTSALCQAAIAAGTAGSINSACATVYNTLPCTGDFCELGYTFSKPKVGKVQVGNDSFGRPVTKPAVFVAGGYDTNKDYTSSLVTLLAAGLASPGSANTNDTKGMAIYVLDAVTGALIWKAVKGTATGPTTDPRIFKHAQLLDSIPSDLTIVDTNGDGAIDRIVVGDTGGNLWRADLGGDDDGGSNPTQAQVTDDWRLTLLAKLGRHSGTGKANDRRFFHEPDYILSRDETGLFDVILIGSGDREDPMDYGRVRASDGTTTLPANAVYAIKDRRTATYSASDSNPADVLTPASLGNVTNNCLQGGRTTTCNPDLVNGWRLLLSQGAGEKVLSSPLTAAFRAYLTTYIPKPLNDTTSCAPSEGTGYFYAINLKDATAVFNLNAADGAGPGNTANSAADRFERLNSAGIPTDVVFVNLETSSGEEAKCVLSADLACREVPGATRFRTHWRKLE